MYCMIINILLKLDFVHISDILTYAFTTFRSWHGLWVTVIFTHYVSEVNYQNVNYCTGITTVP